MDAKGRWNVKATLTGLLAYLAGASLIVMTGAWASAPVAPGGSEASRVVAESGRVLASARFLILCLGLGVPFAVFGGYVATRVAPRATRKLALPVGFLALFAGILCVWREARDAPEWLLAASLLFPLPLALVGGRLTGAASPEASGAASDASGALTKSNLDARRDATQTATGNRRRAPAHRRATTQDATEAAGSSLTIDAADMNQISEEATTGQTHEMATTLQTSGQPTMTQTIEQQVQQIRQNELEHERERADVQQRAHDQSLATPAAEAYEDMREVVRAAFMTHPAATEADFERCWPSLRDEVFKQHALHTYNARRAPKS